MLRVDTSEEGKLRFRNWHKQLPAPYNIYADFQALTIKFEVPAETTSRIHGIMGLAATATQFAVMVKHNNMWYSENLTRQRTS